jgi:hypothetical protein
MVPTSNKKDWLLRGCKSGVLTGNDVELLGRAYAPVAEEFASAMPPNAPKDLGTDVLEARNAVFGADRRFESFSFAKRGTGRRLNVPDQQTVLAKGTVVAKFTLNGAVRYGIVRRILSHRVYNHPLSGKATVFMFQILESKAAPSGLLGGNVTDRRVAVLTRHISLQLILLKPAVPDDVHLYTYNILELGY